jgi:hypothetical protein
VSLRRLLLTAGGGGSFVLSPYEAFELAAAPAAGWNGFGVHAIYSGGKTFFGTITGDGHAQIGEYVHATGVLTLTTIHTWSPTDQHNAPAIGRRSDGKLLTAYTGHQDAHMYTRISTNADDSTAWASETDIDSTLGGTLYTYPALLHLTVESASKFFLFFRDQRSDSAWQYNSTANDGASWSSGTGSTLTSGDRYYGCASHDPSTGRVDFTFIDGSYAEDHASLYHMYYLPGHYYKSDGTEITSEPFLVSEMTKVYDGATAGVRNPATIVRIGSEVAIGFSVQTGTPSGHIGTDGDYKYARWNGSAWSVHSIATAVGMTTFDYTEGGLSIDPGDLDVLLASIRVAGTWTMHRCVTPDSGATWTNTAIDSGAGDAIYPGWVLDHDDGLLAMWLQGSFTDDNVWDAAIMGYRAA